MSLIKLKRIIQSHPIEQIINYDRGRQLFKRGVSFFDSVKIKIFPRAKRMPYFPLKTSVQKKRSSFCRCLLIL